MFAGTDKDEMKKESEFWSIMFLVIGVVSFVANIIQVNLGFICLEVVECKVILRNAPSSVCERYTKGNRELNLSLQSEQNRVI